MLLAMGLAAQWDSMAAQLPPGWTEAALRLRLARHEDAPRAAALLGALSPGIAGDELHLRATSSGDASPGAVRRLLARLDAHGIGGTVELAGEVTGGDSEESVEDAPSKPLAAAWDELVSTLPEDWSDLLCLVELRSSDELAPAALAVAPLNPSRHEGTLGFRFRVARRFGYGAAPGMTRRCLERLDELGIPGELSLFEVLSDTQHVLTQGPTFVVSDRAV
jgi:hypothetical protein